MFIRRLQWFHLYWIDTIESDIKLVKIQAIACSLQKNEENSNLLTRVFFKIRAKNSKQNRSLSIN